MAVADKAYRRFMILDQLIESVNLDVPQKPCEYFNMIGGTSTGGSSLSCSVADCIKTYLSPPDRVFYKTGYRVTVKGKVQDRFDSAQLARTVKEVVAAQGLPEDAPA